MSPLTSTAPGLLYNDGQGSQPPSQVGQQKSLQQPLQEPPQQSSQQFPQQPPQQPKSTNSIFNQQQQSPIPPQTFNKLQKIRHRGRFQDFCSFQGSYRGGYQRDSDREFS